MTPTPHGPGWTPVPAKMDHVPEWRHSGRRLTVSVYDSSVSVTTSKPKMTDGDAEFVRDAFSLGDAPVKWTPGSKGRRCTITEVTE